MINLFAVIGITCSGKSTLLDRLKGRRHLGFVEVGKEMRRRYEIKQFEGKSAKQETEDEVWEIIKQQTSKARNNIDTQHILIDGQPRFKGQAERLYQEQGPYRLVLVFAPRSELMARARKRAETNEQLNFYHNRIAMDYQYLYEAIVEYYRILEAPIISIDSTETDWVEKAIRKMRI